MSKQENHDQVILYAGNYHADDPEGWVTQCVSVKLIYETCLDIARGINAFRYLRKQYTAAMALNRPEVIGLLATQWEQRLTVSGEPELSEESEFVFAPAAGHYDHQLLRFLRGRARLIEAHYFNRHWELRGKMGEKLLLVLGSIQSPRSILISRLLDAVMSRMPCRPMEGEYDLEQDHHELLSLLNEVRAQCTRLHVFYSNRDESNWVGKTLKQLQPSGSMSQAIARELITDFVAGASLGARLLEDKTQQSDRHGLTEDNAQIEDRLVAGSLAERPRSFVVALMQMGATDYSSKQTKEAVVKKFADALTDPNSFGEVLTDLKQRRLIDTTPGRNGGSWLTETGQRVAKMAELLGRMSR